MAALEDNDRAKDRDLDRILALSDGVFAFAITLLALDLVVPEVSGTTGGAFSAAFAGQAQRFVSYLLSFFIVGLWWEFHHRIFRHVRRYDTALMWLNILFLLPVTLTPYFTKLISQFGNLQLPVALYALDAAAVGAMSAVLWRYVSKGHRLIDPSVSMGFIRSNQIRMSIAPILFLASVGISFVSVYLAEVIWVSLFPIGAYTRRRFPLAA